MAENDGFRIGGGVQNLKGGVPPRKHRLEKSNIERLEAEESSDRIKAAGGKILFPMCMYKSGGLTRNVEEHEFDDHVAKGWMTPEQYHAGEVDPVVQDHEGFLSRMAIDEAIAFVGEHGSDVQKLVEMRADEESHGNRVKVLEALAAAEDNIKPAGKKATKGSKK